MNNLQNSHFLVDAIIASGELQDVVKKIAECRDECVRTGDYEEAAYFRDVAQKISEAIDMLDIRIYEQS